MALLLLAPLSASSDDDCYECISRVSQPPIPTPSKSGDEPKGRPGQHQEETSDKQRGTDEIPLRVKIVPSPNAYPESDKTREEKFQKASQDWWIFIAAAATAVFTLVLAIVTGGLWWATYRLYRTTSRAVNDGEQAVKAAMDAAAAADRHVQHAASAAESSRIQADLANKSLIATFRPKLRVRNVVARHTERLTAELQEDGLLPGVAISGQFYVENVGGSDAKLIASHCIFSVQNDNRLPMERPYEGCDPNLPIASGSLIPAGGSYPGIFQPFTLTEDEVDRISQNLSFLYLMGWIEYEDNSKIIRRMAFCRQYDPERHRFVRVNDGDYDYEE
jgi:hypothetical protein